MDERYTDLAKRIGLGHSERIAQIFSMIADSDEADLLLALPADAATAAEKLGRSPGSVDESLRGLFVKGLVFPSYKTDPPTYRMSRDFVQFHDATILWPDAPAEFLSLWQEFMEEEWPATAKVFSQMTPRPFTRVIPVGATVQSKTHVLAFEDIADIVEKANRLAVTKCTCRLTAGKCGKSLETCIQVNRAADYTLVRGTGRELTKDEAMDLVRKCEEEGLIHVVMNKQSVDHFICNCCECCCQTMPILIKHNISVIEPSRFVAEINPAECTVCGQCVDRCFFGAIALDDETASVNPELCMGCGLCQVVCEPNAIELKEARTADFVPEKLFG